MSGSYFHQLAGEWKHRGISLADGTKWQQNRKFTIATLGKLGFNKDRLQSFARIECAKVLDNLVELKGHVVDFEKEVVGAVANVTLQMVMGHQFDLQDPQIQKLKEAIFVIVSVLSHIQSYLDFFPWMARFAGKNSDVKTLTDAFQDMSDFMQTSIDEHIETLDEAHPRDFIDAFLLQTPREDRDTSTDNLRMILKDVVLGALEPGPVMLSWIILLLAKHPDVQEKVCVELVTILGPDRAPSAEDERQCPYARAVIEETLRFVTLTPINRHFATMGATTLRGYDIPAGAIILADQHSLHHDPAVWGDPEIFRPERFLGADGAKLREQVRGFGFGPRVCIAEAHIRSLLFTFMAGLLRRLEFRLPEKGQVTASSAYHIASRPSQTLLVPYPRQ